MLKYETPSVEVENMDPSDIITVSTGDAPMGDIE